LKLVEGLGRFALLPAAAAQIEPVSRGLDLLADGFELADSLPKDVLRGSRPSLHPERPPHSAEQPSPDRPVVDVREGAIEQLERLRERERGFRLVRRVDAPDDRFVESRRSEKMPRDVERASARSGESIGSPAVDLL